MNWVTLISDDIKAAGHGNIVDRAGALAAGSVHPVTDAIESTVAEIRLAVSAGNPLDPDESKIPLALKKVAVRLILFMLMERIGLVLKDTQEKQRELDNQFLRRLAERKIVMSPDPTKAPENRGTWSSERKLIMRTHPVPAPGRQHSPEGGYGNPEGPEDFSE